MFKTKIKEETTKIAEQFLDKIEEVTNTLDDEKTSHFVIAAASQDDSDRVVVRMLANGGMEELIEMLERTLMGMLNSENKADGNIAAQAILRTISKHRKLRETVKNVMPLMEIMGVLDKVNPKKAA